MPQLKGTQSPGVSPQPSDSRYQTRFTHNYDHNVHVSKHKVSLHPNVQQFLGLVDCLVPQEVCPPRSVANH